MTYEISTPFGAGLGVGVEAWGGIRDVGGRWLQRVVNGRRCFVVSSKHQRRQTLRP